MSPLEKIEVIKNTIGHLPFEVRAAYTNGISVRRLWEERRLELVTALSQHPGPDPLDIGNGVGHAFRVATSKMFAELPVLKMMVDLSDSSEAFTSAYATVHPLIEQITALHAEHKAALAEKGERHRILREAEEHALEAARIAALQTPAVIAARMALEALDAPAKAPRAKAEG